MIKGKIATQRMEKGVFTKRACAIILSFVLTMSISISVLAHSGRTDGAGGHYDHSTDEYHYHHGYPAHQHKNGMCPYSFDDNADSRNNASSNKRKTTKSTSSESDENWFSQHTTVTSILICIVILFGPGIIGTVFGKCKAWIKNRKDKSRNN